MAAQASNSSNANNLVQVFVKTLAGDLLSIDVNPRGTKKEVEARVMDQLRKIAPEEFPEGKAVVLTPIGRTKGNNDTNASVNKVVGNITQIVNGDMIMALVTNRVATLVDCHEAKEERPGVIAYEFDVLRKDGVLIRSVRDLDNRVYSKKQIHALIEQFPIQQLTVHYSPEAKYHFYVMPHKEDINYLERVSPITKNKTHFAHYYAEKSFIPVQRNVNNNNNNEWQAEEFEESEEFVNPTPEGQKMNVGVIVYTLTPDAIRDIREQIQAAQCTPADAEIMTHSFGGRRRKGLKKSKKAKKGNSKSNKVKKGNSKSKSKSKKAKKGKKRTTMKKLK